MCSNKPLQIGPRTGCGWLIGERIGVDEDRHVRRKVGEGDISSGGLKPSSGSVANCSANSALPSSPSGRRSDGPCSGRCTRPHAPSHALAAAMARPASTVLPVNGLKTVGHGLSPPRRRRPPLILSFRPARCRRCYTVVGFGLFGSSSSVLIAAGSFSRGIRESPPIDEAARAMFSASTSKKRRRPCGPRCGRNRGAREQRMARKWTTLARRAPARAGRCRCPRSCFGLVCR